MSDYSINILLKKCWSDVCSWPRSALQEGPFCAAPGSPVEGPLMGRSYQQEGMTLALTRSPPFSKQHCHSVGSLGRCNCLLINSSVITEVCLRKNIPVQAEGIFPWQFDANPPGQ
jgi:hypothetical protein